MTTTEIQKGQMVQTKSGKIRVVTGTPYTPHASQDGRLCVSTRGTRDGKPFGASRSYPVEELRVVNPTGDSPEPEMVQTTFTVKTCYGWGWRIPQESGCPKFGSQHDAQRYADLRNEGYSHLWAWDIVEAERHEKPEPANLGDPD